MDGDNLARIRRAEGDFLFSHAAILKHRHEQRFTGEQTFARAQQRTQKPAVLLRTVAEDCFHLDAVFHEHHAARFGDDGFHRVQFHFDELHVVAVNFEIDLVHYWHRRSPNLFRGEVATGKGKVNRATKAEGSAHHAVTFDWLKFWRTFQIGR